MLAVRTTVPGELRRRFGGRLSLADVAALARAVGDLDDGLAPVLAAP